MDGNLKDYKSKKNTLRLKCKCLCIISVWAVIWHRSVTSLKGINWLAVIKFSFDLPCHLVIVAGFEEKCLFLNFSYFIICKHIHDKQIEFYFIPTSISLFPAYANSFGPSTVSFESGLRAIKSMKLRKC